MESKFLKNLLNKITKKKVLPYNLLEKKIEKNILDLIKEAQKQITKGNVNQAKKIYQDSYRLYCKLPTDEQVSILPHLTKIQDQITGIKKNKEEIKELTNGLLKLKSEREIHIIFDKSNIHRRLDFLIKYTQKLEKQGLHGLEAGKIHLKEKLNGLIESAEKKEIQERKKLTQKEKSFLTKIKQVGTFYTKKEESLEKMFQQTQKRIFDHLHNITKQIKISIHPKTKKKIIKNIPKSKPSAIPIYKRIEKKEDRILEEIERLLTYLKKRREEGTYKLKPKGKEFLDKIEAIVNTIKENEQKGITALKDYEKEFINAVSLFIRKKGESLHLPEGEKTMLEFLEYMKKEEMVHMKEQKLQREKLKFKPLIKTPKVKMDIKRLKKLAKEEERVMHKIQKIPQRYPLPIQRVQKKRLEKYNWESPTSKTKKRRTKEILDLVKEEEKILSKINEFEKKFQ